MKIRNSFVTNSSSTSYVLIGVEIDTGSDLFEKIIERAEDIDGKSEKPILDEDDIDYAEAVDLFFNSFNHLKNGIQFGYDYEMNILFVGIFNFYNEEMYGDKTVSEIYDLALRGINEIFDGLGGFERRDVHYIEEISYG